MSESKVKYKPRLMAIIPFILLLVLALVLLASKSDIAFKIIGYRGYVVLSESMKPSILAGDVVIVRDANRCNIKENDVVTFNQDNEVITHRIKGVLENGYITKGDNNKSEDFEILSREDIIGKVVLRIPLIGRLIMFISNPYIMSVELVFLGVILIAGICK